MYQGEGDDDDDNLEYCAVCSRGSSLDHPLFCCEGCPTSYHAACLPTEDFDRIDLWTCPDCRDVFADMEDGAATGTRRQQKIFLAAHGWDLQVGERGGGRRSVGRSVGRSGGKEEGKEGGKGGRDDVTEKRGWRGGGGGGRGWGW
jgi:hypothetical protein